MQSIFRNCFPTPSLTACVVSARRSSVEYQEKLETFKPGYPAMVQINNKIKEIDQQLATEVQTIKDSLKAAYESSVSSRKSRCEIELKL